MDVTSNYCWFKGDGDGHAQTSQPKEILFGVIAPTHKMTTLYLT